MRPARKGTIFPRMTILERTATARRLLTAGARLKTVLRDCGITQRRIAKKTGVRFSHVSEILGSAAGARKQGQATARRVYSAAAAAVGLVIGDIPEAHYLLLPEEPRHVNGKARRPRSPAD